MTDAVASILPPNATPVAKAVEAATARLGEVPVQIREVWNADTCPQELLPWLAWGLGLQTWSSDWPEAVQRQRVKNAIPIARTMGTAKSVRDVVASFGGAVALKEWWETDPPGTPGTFTLVVQLNGPGGSEATSDFVNQVIDEVTRTKPVRAHFTFTQGLAAAGAIGMAGGARTASFARVQSGF